MAFQRLKNENVILRRRIKKLEEDVEYFEKRMKTLSKALTKSLSIPDIKPIVKDVKLKVVKPYSKPPLRDLVAADLEYYALPKEVWEYIDDAVISCFCSLGLIFTFDNNNFIYF